jgi:hypothetical protein
MRQHHYDRPEPGMYSTHSRQDPYELPHRGGLILALGIISLLVCAPVGIAAWLMANHDLQAIQEGVMDPDGESLTLAGKILGIIATGLFAIQLLIFASFLALFIFGLALAK